MRPCVLIVAGCVAVLADGSVMCGATNKAADMYQEKGDLVSALNIHKSVVLQRGRGYERSLYKVGELLALQNDATEGERWLRRFISEYPDSPYCDYAHYWLGCVLLWRDVPVCEEATTEFQWVLNHSQNTQLLMQAQYCLAEALLQRGRKDEAVRHFAILSRNASAPPAMRHSAATRMAEATRTAETRTAEKEATRTAETRTAEKRVHLVVSSIDTSATFATDLSNQGFYALGIQVDGLREGDYAEASIQRRDGTLARIGAGPVRAATLFNNSQVRFLIDSLKFGSFLKNGEQYTFNIVVERNGVTAHATKAFTWTVPTQARVIRCDATQYANGTVKLVKAGSGLSGGIIALAGKSLYLDITFSDYDIMAGDAGGYGGVYRGFMRFDLKGVPVNAIITAATLVLHCQTPARGIGPDKHTVELHRIRSDPLTFATSRTYHDIYTIYNEIENGVLLAQGIRADHKGSYNITIPCHAVQEVLPHGFIAIGIKEQDDTHREATFQVRNVDGRVSYLHIEYTL